MSLSLKQMMQTQNTTTSQPTQQGMTQQVITAQPQVIPSVQQSQQPKTIVIQPQASGSGTQQVQLQLRGNTASVPTATVSGAQTQKLIMATIASTIPGTSKLILTNSMSGGVQPSQQNSLQGLLSTSTSTAAAPKQNVFTIQTTPGATGSNMTHIKIAPNTSLNTSPMKQGIEIWY